jgi:hypothetical protein
MKMYLTTITRLDGITQQPEKIGEFKHFSKVDSLGSKRAICEYVTGQYIAESNLIFYTINLDNVKTVLSE